MLYPLYIYIYIKTIILFLYLPSIKLSITKKRASSVTGNCDFLARTLTLLVCRVCRILMDISISWWSFCFPNAMAPLVTIITCLFMACNSQACNKKKQVTCILNSLLRCTFIFYFITSCRWIHSNFSYQLSKCKPN